jgi:hypothetical protein
MQSMVAWELKNRLFMKYFFIIGLLITSLCFLEKEVHAKTQAISPMSVSSSKGITQSKKYQYKSIYVKPHETFFLYEDKKELWKIPSELLTMGFLEASFVHFKQKTYLLLKWTSGAHGEEIHIYDFNNGKKHKEMVFLYASSWDLKWKFQDQKIHVYGKSDMDKKTGTPYEENFTWDPSQVKP